MSETINIAGMADKVGDEVLSEFFWTRVGPKNHRWPCLNPNHKSASGARDKREHPTDVAFQYDDPYSNERVFVNVDLKAFKGTSFTASGLASAMESLTMSVACANISAEWKQDFEAEGKNPRVVGLLFAFNHDDNFNGNFHALVRTGFRSDSQNRLEGGQRVFALGPKDIEYLVQVASDLQRLRSLKKLPAQSCYGFYSPDLTLRESRGKTARAATLQTLISPIQIVRYEDTAEGGCGTGYVIYYRGPGDTKEEFQHLFSMLLHYQLFRDAGKILVSCPNASTKASGKFEAAKSELKESLGGIAAVEEKVNIVTFRVPHKAAFQLNEFLLGQTDV